MSTDSKKLREIGNIENDTGLGKIRIKKKSKKSDEAGAPESKSSVKLHLNQSQDP